ncbi:MAG: glycogen/starch synthase [Flavobacteriales bacterium]|nr:glycogen/starch synthase [Bacteroidota bacterium]MCB9241649.1 glycogen/starch synthase [Flavobacteriales bacterium]
MENNKKKVLFISSEMSPFLESNALSDIARMLPQAVQEQDNEVRILVPRFGVINERRNRLHEVVRLSGMNITIDDNDNPLTIKVASIPSTKMQVYFLDNEDYFHRKHVYSDENDEFFADNDERTIFFCKGALETVKKLGWYPDIIHCHGWMTSLIPLYLKTIYRDEPVFQNAKIVYSVFNKEYQDSLGNDFTRKASLNHITDEHMKPFENGDCSSLYIGAITHSDAIVNCADTLDPQVASHLQNDGTKPVLEHRGDNIAEEYTEFYDNILAQN